jgi:hypothetical protein
MQCSNLSNITFYGDGSIKNIVIEEGNKVLNKALYNCSEHKLSEPKAIYVKIPEIYSWSNVYIWYWTDTWRGSQEIEGNVSDEYKTLNFPGPAMTLVDPENNIYGFILPEYTNMIIFTFDDMQQTVDLILMDCNYYVLSESGTDVIAYGEYEDTSGIILNSYLIG